LIELTNAQGGYVHYVVATGMIGDQWLVNDPGDHTITTLADAKSNHGAAGYVVRGFLTDPPQNDHSDVSIAIRGAGTGASLSIRDSQGRVTGGKGFDGTEQFQIPGSDFSIEDNTDPVTGAPSGNPILIVNIVHGAGVYDVVASPSGLTYPSYGLMIYGLDKAGIQLVPVMDAFSGEQAFTITVNPALPFPSFARLSAPTITYGTASTTISGQLNANAGGLPVPAGEAVLVTVDGVTHSAALDGSDDFSTSFDTSVLETSGSPYTIGFSYTGDANLNAASASSTLMVARAPLTVTMDSKTKVYGAALPTFTGTLTGVVNGDAIAASYNTSATATSDVLTGGYPITATLNDPNNRLGNYTVTNTPARLTITPANQTITWSNPLDIVYGTALSATQLNASVSVVGPASAGALTYSPAAGTLLNAGNNQTLTVTAAATTDYSAATATVSLNVSQVTLTVTANDRTIVYAQSIPQVDGILSGVVQGDNITARYTTSATSTSNVGTYVITPSLNDPNGRLANYVVTMKNGALTIQNVAIEPDPVNRGQNDLFVGGTSGDDHIEIDADHHGTIIDVNIRTEGHDGRDAVTFSGDFDASTLSRIFVFGGPGNDDIEVDKRVILPALLFGGDGNDHIEAGGGPTVVVGGSGNDHLEGGSGNDILIGGTGKDHLEGNRGSDILIGGTTDFDNNLPALIALMSEWGRTDESYWQRVANLSNSTVNGVAPNGTGLNWSTFLNSTTVHDDGVRNDLDGGPGMGWFFGGIDGSGNDTEDGLRGLRRGKVISHAT
jgi:Ca2+-binding RTX toxin-like protein